MADRDWHFRNSVLTRKALISWLVALCVIAFGPLTLRSQERRLAPVAAAAGQKPELKSDTLVLVAPLISEYAYLIDANAKILHQWKFGVTGNNAYLFPDGTLYRLSQEPEIDLFNGRGSAGRIQKVDWEGNLLWDFKYASQDHLQHHDIEVLPNGNVLLIAWERISKSDAIAAGRAPENMEADELYSEKIVEIKPEGKTGGREVWVWRLWDHLVQDHDSTKPNYGDPAKQVRRVDLNFFRGKEADWIHMNAIDYRAEFDQIIMSPRYFDELWVVDHSTSTEEARSSTGGRFGHGGDLLYRCGNPMSYRHGKLEDKILFGQHNPVWIPKGYPGEGDVTVFNNGTSKPRVGFSSVDQLKLPVDGDGKYRMQDSGAFARAEVVWSYSRGEEMFSFRISGAERLATGNTLICSGHQPWILEVSPDKSVVWETKYRFGGANGDTPNEEKGAMFRAPGYTIDYFNAEIRQKLSAGTER